jgi:hypothetical protein
LNIILLGLLIYDKNNPMQPFYPIQQYGKKKIQQVQDFGMKWESELIVALQNTKNNNKA